MNLGRHTLYKHVQIGDHMNKWIISIGIIILLAGLILVSSSNVQEQEINQQLEASAERQWNISGVFQQGENLTLDFRPHSDWSLPFYEPYPEYAMSVKYFYANITNTVANNYTLIKVTLVPPVVPEPPYSFLLYPESITVIHHGGITVEDCPEKIGGIAKDNGLYLVNCSLFPPLVQDRDLQGNPWPHDASPPPWFYLYKEKWETKYPYNFLFLLGISISICGIGASMWGARSQRKKRKSTLKNQFKTTSNFGRKLIWKNTRMETRTS